MTESARKTSLSPAIAAFGCVALLLMAMLIWPDAVQRAGLGEKLWYVTAVLVGIGAAFSVYALSARSYAHYKGHAANGTLELRGPIVLVLVFVVLAFALPSKPVSRVDVTVFLTPPEGAAPSVTDGARLTLDLGPDRRIEPADGKGVVRVIGVPADQAGRAVRVSLDSAVLALAGPASIQLTQEPVYLPTRWKTWQLSGSVLDTDGTPVAQANVGMLEQRTLTDSSGRFSLVLSAEVPDAERVLQVEKVGFAQWRGGIAQGVGGATVQLQKLP